LSKNLVVLASYPKTGSTWLRKIIAETVSKEESADVVVPSFFKHFPSVKEYTVNGKTLGFVKTHIHPEHVNFGKLVGEINCIVTIYRHPLDVLLSSLNYARVKGNSSYFVGNEIKTVEQIIADNEIQFYVDEFIKNDGFTWYSSQCGSFSLYQQRWRKLGALFPYLEICYEDMVAAPSETLAGLFQFLLDAPDQERIDFILRRADARTQADGDFYWRRQAFGYKSLLPSRVYDDINRQLRPMLELLGYKN
jgi:hypothetical protein